MDARTKGIDALIVIQRLQRLREAVADPVGQLGLHPMNRPMAQDRPLI